MNNQSYLTAGLCCGFGLGGLVNTILLMQVFRLHQMFSANIASDNLTSIRVNTFWTAIFEILLLALVTVGIFLLWSGGRNKRVQWPGQYLAGSMLAGWGSFNLAEGFIAHHLMGIHHVVESSGMSEYDYLYIAVGLAFILVGSLLILHSRKRRHAYFRRRLRAEANMLAQTK